MTRKHSNSYSNENLKQESLWINIILLLLSLSILSGVLLSLTDMTIGGLPYFSQWNLIGHTVSSSFALLPLGFYCYFHFKRTLGIRHSILIFSGLFTCLLFIALFGTGLWMAIFGQTEQLTWLDWSHTTTAYIVILLLVLHVASYILYKKRKNKESNKSLFITLSHSSTYRALCISAIYLLGIVLVTLIYTSTMESTAIVKTDYVYEYGDHPFRPSQTETTSGHFINTEQIAKSQQCGSCHTEIYQQWLSSAHRQAASDPAYVKNINLLEKKRGTAATRYCEGCHAPVALLTGELTPGGQHGGVPDTPAHLEGVGCMGCHGISKIPHLNGTASYTFDPKEHYLFDSNTTLAAQKIRNFLIRLNPTPHKQAMGSELMQDPKLCASCHEQFMDKSMNNWGWVKMQSDYTHWLASPFSGQNEQSFQTEAQLNCQSCHFPLVKGNDPSADHNGFIHSHRSLGANTVLPLLNGDKEQLQATQEFLQNAKILVDIEEPHRKDTIQNHQFIDQNLRPKQQDNTPFFLYLGEQSHLRVTVTNRMVGHNFPAGTTDINQAWLYFKVSDADNQIIYESGSLDENLFLDKEAHIYHSIPVDRTGKAIWKHDLFRMTGNAYKNVIPSGKSDIKEYTFTVPSWAKEPLTAIAIIKYRKFNQRYAQWALDHPKPILPIVNMARDSLTIPLKIKPVIQ